MKYSICPNCGNITEWPDTARPSKKTCMKCFKTMHQPLADDRETAEKIIKHK